MGGCMSLFRSSSEVRADVQINEERKFAENLSQPPRPKPDDAHMDAELWQLGVRQTTGSKLPEMDTPQPSPSDSNFSGRGINVDAAFAYASRHHELSLGRDPTRGSKLFDRRPSIDATSVLSGASSLDHQLRAELAEYKRQIDDLDATGDDLTGEALDEHERQRDMTLESYSKLERVLEERAYRLNAQRQQSGAGAISDADHGALERTMSSEESVSP